MSTRRNIEVVSAGSILGLKQTGVERLPTALLSKGLLEKLDCLEDLREIPLRNNQYNQKRDPQTNCLNPESIRNFSLVLADVISSIRNENRFPLVLGGDCSVLLGIMPALKTAGRHGLIFCDAHADFYQPEKSVTGEVADMDLAIVTGRGPELLTNILGQMPYVLDENVVHIGQRDAEETNKYGSQDIRETGIHCFDLDSIRREGIEKSLASIVRVLSQQNVQGYWLHFDTDVISDEENPAVDYRLPGGLSFEECKILLQTLIRTNSIVGLSVTIFNPLLDFPGGTIAEKITNLLSDALNQTHFSSGGANAY